MKNFFLLLAVFLIFSCTSKNDVPFSKLEGYAFGTTFHITFENVSKVSEQQIDSIIYQVNKSLSTYIKNSDISKINRGDTTVVVDNMFVEVFNKSDKIHKETKGAFDPTIGIMVNAWGFGPEKELSHLNKSQVDSLMQFVGFEKISLKGHKIMKAYAPTYLDFNAIAKGYAVDVIGRFLTSKNCSNYMVEIGGEIRVRGKNEKNNIWKIAIEKPNFDGSRSFQTVVELNNESIATSGNYRKFKIDPDTGEKFAHTIDTQTGYSSKSNLLSASVISNMDCANVDAYATAFMAMGFEKSKVFLEKHKALKAFLIYSNEQGELKTFTTKNLHKTD